MRFSSGDFAEYWERRTSKLEKQVEKAETNIFKGCTFYILGYVGRGEKSRYLLVKKIEKNGGRNVLMFSSNVTHIICNNICQRKKVILEKAIEARKIFLITPNYIDDCIDAGSLIDPGPYLTEKQKTKTLDFFMKKENPK